MALLECRGVNVAYEPSRGQRIWAVRDVDLALEPGEFVGIVGESGCGKTTLGYALTRMLRPPARLESGLIRFDGIDIATLRGEQLRRQRRNGFALVLQSGMNALNPVRTVEHHFGDDSRPTPGRAMTCRPTASPPWRRVARGCPARVRSAWPVPARAVRRHAPARLDRAGAGPGAATDRLRRADDGARRDRAAGRDADDQGAAARPWVYCRADKPRPRRGARGDRPGHGRLRGADVKDQRPPPSQAGQHHPYTEALLDCYADPRADVVQLAGIPGSPPDLSLPQAGCSFAPRCPLAEHICLDQDSPLSSLGLGGRRAMSGPARPAGNGGRQCRLIQSRG